MSKLDILAAVAQKELAKLEAEERRRENRLQPTAAIPRPEPEPEPIRFCRPRKSEYRKTHVVADDDDEEAKPVSPSGHDDRHRLPGTRTESKPKKVSSLKFAMDFIIRKEKEEEEIGSKKNNKEKTEVIINGPDSPSKKRKPRNHNMVGKISKRTKQQEAADNGHGPNPNPNPDPKPGLPEIFREKIRERARGREVGSELLVIQKTLTSTDLQDHHNRFSMPFKQITKERFLKGEDVEFLERREANGRCNVINIGIIEAEGKVESVNLTRWVMKKPNGEPSISYVLNGEGWKRVKMGNKLGVGDVVQLWAVPIGGDPCFVFVKLD